MDDQKQKAFSIVEELTKQLISLSTLIVTLMMTLGKDFKGTDGIKAEIKVFFYPWLLLFISIFFGICVFMRLAGVLDKYKANEASIYKARIFSILQIITFLIGFFWCIVEITQIF